MPKNKVKPSEIIETSFVALRPKDESGRSWRERESLFKGLWAIAPMSARAVETILDVAISETDKTKSATKRTVDGFTFALEEHGDTHWKVSIKENCGPGEWSVRVAHHMGKNHFVIRRLNEDTAEILVSGTLSRKLKVISINHDPANFRDLTRLATSISLGLTKRHKQGLPADPIASVLSLDGGVPGENARRLHRMLYEDATRRAMEWAAPLFEKLTKLYVKEGLKWGAEAAQWSMPSEGPFPDFRSPTTISCLVSHPASDTTAMVFRDAQPNIKTESYIVWREADGLICLMPVREGEVDDIDDFQLSGGVAALTYDPRTSDVHATERAISSRLLQSFCDHWRSMDGNGKFTLVCSQ
jgi:hypothetical protein